MLSLQEYMDIITTFHMTPGPLVVNTASFVGIRIAGIPGGAVTATVTIIAVAFFGTMAINFSTINIAAMAVFAISVILLRKFKLNAILIIAATGVLGLILY